MTRLEALKEAEALVERLTPDEPTETPRDAARRIDPTKPPKVQSSIGERISQILRVADYLMKEGEQ